LNCLTGQVKGAADYKSLTEGAKVEYQVEDGPKGPQARDFSVVAPG
jgi:cold shock CspA family protein